MADQVDVLLVEDDIGDIELVRESFKISSFNVNLFVVHDGVECLEYLQGSIEDQSLNRPDLILLDLNMPKKDGRQVLQEIRSDERFKTIPVVILTTSDAESDIHKTYELGANCYVTKPVDFDQFQLTIQEISDFWFKLVKLPTMRKTM